MFGGNMITVLLAAVLAAPAAAQQADFALQGQRASAVQTTLTAMNDGNTVGMKLAAVIRETGARVVFRKTGMMSALSLGADGKPVIALDPSLPLAPRVLAPRLAREAAKMLLTGMPDTAEKLYMARSLEVRAWLELGGDPSALPVIDPVTGTKDAKLAAEFKEWLGEDAQTALYRMGQASGLEDIPTKMQALRDRLATLYSTPENIAELHRQLEAYETANRDFTRFLLEEREWRQANGY
ncbi:MAG: hypothetical protein KGL53_08060 [Elusimicrobia bacterium]|nr:hypothetical protein [Elusimicrobiota bacterium]